MTTSEEYAKKAELNSGSTYGHVWATLSVAAAIREQTEQARENTLELACASRGVASPHPTWYS
jgi:hypothetical protein